MNKLKGWITTFALVLTLMTSTTPAFADGVLVGGRAISNPSGTPCAQNTTGQTDLGVLVGGFTGVLVGGFTGILYGGGLVDNQTNCGILYGG